MQVNATLIAAQQAAREAQARFQAAHVAPKTAQPAAANFAAALEKDLFEPLPIKQTQAQAPQAAAALSAMANPSPASRPGSLLDIKV
jgi:hypothetical protein